MDHGFIFDGVLGPPASNHTENNDIIIARSLKCIVKFCLCGGFGRGKSREKVRRKKKHEERGEGVPFSAALHDEEKEKSEKKKKKMKHEK
ncbi:hypothetical protein SUGI_0630420 [Cryptomeria japonica]|nr:hypothetical protein SUGI_0630420 [Cryptomeria japonica]